ncbi:MAG: acyl-CoA dehydrogenase family protein [Longimicrobiales bacterium]
MDRYLTPAHHELRESVASFARDTIAPVAKAHDESGAFPWSTVAAIARRGLLGVPMPTELDGLGQDTLGYILVIEELAKVDASHAITVSAHTTLGTSPIASFGTREQQERFVPILARGEVLGGFGLTEANAGSDASGTRTRATPVEGGYRLSGGKVFITNAGVGEIFVVTAVTDPSARTHGITSFIVCKPTAEPESAAAVGFGHRADLPFSEGFRAGKPEDKMGWRASDTRELILEDVFVPLDQRLGAEGHGFVNFMKTLDAGRIGIAALSLGLAESALEIGVRYAGSRQQFGQAVWEFQPIQFRLADLATDVEAGRHLTYHAAWLKDRGEPYSKQAAMAKLFCSELAMRATLGAIQVMGAAGYTSDYPVERMMRDAKICEIGEGTNEIQRLVIARHVAAELADR